MCSSGSKQPEVTPYKIAKPAATPPSPIEPQAAPEIADSVNKKKRSTPKGKLALRSDITTPDAAGLNIFK